jgi:two-component system chemotaxis sensor kinase CheA
MEKGLVPPGSELSEKEIFALIFAPGFSTAQKVTGISGRGVGMDVVKRNIEELRGSIEIKSEKDRGTTITIRLPLTLAIMECLLVKVGDEHFLVPLPLVEECMFLTREEVARAHGRQVVQVREHIVPYIRLRRRFAMRGQPPAIEQLVIVQVEGERVGLAVDRIIGHHQTVIKALGSAYKQVEWVSGATILGDGSVALILDLARLYEAEELEAKAA